MSELGFVSNIPNVYYNLDEDVFVFSYFTVQVGGDKNFTIGNYWDKRDAELLKCVMKDSYKDQSLEVQCRKYKRTLYELVQNSFGITLPRLMNDKDLAAVEQCRKLGEDIKSVVDSFHEVGIHNFC